MLVKVSYVEFLLRGIPEGLLFYFAAYAFTKQRIHLKRYFLSCILQSVIVYLIRFLPIQNGTDAILNLILLITLSVIINKFEIIQAIRAGIIIILLEFICEAINVYFIQFILKKDLNLLFNNPMQKILYSSPSLLLFGCLAIGYYIILRKRNELKII
ncbi:hypothetical protein [Candidatus Clostridium radicumherbarum]|uniref:ComEC/Rec2-related protein domain-containing protein n=1 Tax=Candidatus Clostridium radicumherbarum TaxID=3381662 RepID=A0ABW8TPM1_9CLOT